jgi:hypothetical protein
LFAKERTGKVSLILNLNSTAHAHFTLSVLPSGVKLVWFRSAR